jgi:serpin B
MKLFHLRSVQLAAVLLISIATSQAAPNTAAIAINDLGVDLLRQTSRPDANAVLSPYSIQSALAMAYAGADGDTRQEMAKALHFSNDSTLDQSFAALRKSLEDAVRQSAESAARDRKLGVTNDPLVLTVANRLFGQTGYEFRKPFLDLLRNSYAAPFEALDFKKNPAKAARHINGWVEAQTRNRIRNLISEGALEDATRLVLVNAIYLKSPWREHFTASSTKTAPFYIKGGQPVDVPMMHQSHDFPFVQRDGFVAVSLPLDYPLQFILFLPTKRDGLAQLEKQFSPALLSGGLQFETRDVTLSLPKFKIEPPVLTLNTALQNLGMKTAFDIPPGSANFDRIAPNLAISDVFHKTFLNVDEKGVEAAAATAVTIVATSFQPPAKPVEVTVDHPFLFAIVSQPRPDETTCLFLGHIVDPR